MRSGCYLCNQGARTGLLLLFCLLHAPGFAASLLLSPGSSVKNFSLPIYPPGKQSPSVIVTADRAQCDSQRKLFFRVALLPRVVAEGVTFEFLEPPTADLLKRVSRQLCGDRPAHGLILQRVRFRVVGQPSLSVTADSMQTDASGRWELRGHVAFANLGQRREVPQASLWLEGINAGALEWRDASGPHLSPWIPTSAPKPPPP